MTKHSPSRGNRRTWTRRRVALPALLVLVVAAGCLGGTGTTPTPEPPATERPPSTTDCPASVSVDRVDDVSDDATVIPYEELPSARRAEFDAALSEGYAEVEDGGEAYRFWVDRPYVRYDGAVYQSVVAVC